MTLLPPDARIPAAPAPVADVLNAVLTALIEHASISAAAPAMIRAICDALDFDVGAVWLVDDDAGRMQCVGVWARDPGGTAAFVDATQTRTFVIGEGLPGRVWRTSAPAVTGDVTRDDNFPRRDVARSVGLRGAFAFPITGDGRVLGVIEGFRSEERTPDPELLRAVQAVGRQVGLAVLRERVARGQAEATARLTTLVRSLHAGTIVEDEHRRIILANQAYCDLFAIPDGPTSLEGAEFATCIERLKGMVRDPDAFAASTQRAVEDLLQVDSEVLELRDGRVFERDYAPVHVEGVLRGHVWRFRDVTATHAAEQENIRLRHFYEQVLESAPAQIAVFDEDCRFLYLNSASIADPEVRRWVLGKTNEDYCRHRGIPVEIGEQRTERIRRVLRERRQLQFEESFERHGQVRRFARLLAPVFNASGDVVQVVGFGLDLTEVRHAQEALAASEARLRGILASALDCVITIDREGRVLDFSPAAEQTFGYTREAILGRTMADYIVPLRYREAHRRGMRRYLETGANTVLRRRIEISAIRANGEEFPAELAITPVPMADGEEIFTAFLRDITERKRVEAEVQEARLAAERSAAAKDQFLANVSHELRTPLNAIVGLAHLLDRSPRDAKQSRSVDGIRSAADALLTVINDLLDLSRIRSGHLTFETIPFELRPLLEGLVSSVAAAAHDRGLSLVLDVDEDVPQVLSGDPGRLNQVLLNLVGNALRFTDRGGITVRVSREGDGPEPGTIRFSVIDSGIGIAPEDQDRIFQIFEQANAEISKRHGGSGLGLAIVRELVQQQGGSVSVESEPGRGSAFHVSLPFAVTGEHAVVTSVEASPTLLRGARLLLVEDNELNRFVATEILERAGAHVTIATNGREALSAVSTQPFDLVLMDIQMPEMDGFDAAWRIRHELGIPEARLPIVALTATALTEEQRRAEASGMSDFILKPFRPELLCQRVAAIIAGIAPGGPVAAATHVNRRALEENTLHQAAFTRQVLEIFLRSVPEEIERLEAALTASDCASISALAHQMKSQAGTIGAEGLQHTMQRLELSCRGASSLTPAIARDASDAARLGRDVLADVRAILSEYAEPAS